MKKMENIIEEIQASLKKIPGIRFGFMDASLVKNRGESEVDIIVPGGPDLVEMDQVVSEAEEKLGRPLSINSYTVRELQERIKVKDEAILRTLQGPKIMLLGNEEEMKTTLVAEV